MNQNDNNKETHDQDNIEANCLFCKVLRSETPSTKVYEDDETLAFLNIFPHTRGHMLIIPKNHHENIYSTPVETWCRMNITAQKITIAMKNALSADGVNLLMNNESSAGQVIFHTHIHIIPRYNDFTEEKYTYAENETDELAKELKEVL
ncbi:HIT family protein [Candidatus Parcubacteria bacterium]|nr:HIT family protein [Candidatus Parcubacteria bacterium]